MPVGKSSIDRIAKAGKKPTEGIHSSVPEVPVGDPAKPAAPKKTVKKPAAQAKKTASQASKKAEPTKISTFAIGQELPFWLL